MKSMKNLSKRGLCLLLVLIMSLGMLNLTAFADEVDGETIEAVEAPAEAKAPAYATMDDFNAACAAMGDADDEESILAVLDGIETVYANMSDEDKEAVADQWAYVQSYRESIDAGNPDQGIELMADSYTTEITVIFTGALNYSTVYKWTHGTYDKITLGEIARAVCPSGYCVSSSYGYRLGNNSAVNETTVWSDFYNLNGKVTLNLDKTCNYTVEWYDTDSKTIKKAETRTGAVGKSVSATENDKTINGYRYVSDRSTEKATLTGSGVALKLYFVKTVTVTWMNGYDDTALKTSTIDKGSDYSSHYPANPTRDDYKFTSWSNPETDASGNITITARWEAHQHSYTRTKAPTCTEKGEETCFCGDTKEIAALGHDMVTDEAVAATCTKTGLTEGSHCSRCDDITIAQTVVAALGHDMTGAWTQTKAPTCTEKGEEDTVCQRTGCDHKETREVAALGHDMVTDKAEAPTCTTTGLTEGNHCSRCDDATTAQTVVAALGHTWDNGVKTESSCTDEGNMLFNCTVCGETKKEVIDATGHTMVTDEAVAPTCTEAGLTEGSHCSVCNAVIEAQETVPATGHDMQESEAAVPATCETDGKTAVLTCANGCGHTEGGEKTDATGHTWGEWESTDEKQHSHTCTVDDCAAVEAADHTWDGGKVTKAATATEKGVKTFTCTAKGCGATRTEEIPATGSPSQSTTYTYTLRYDANGGTGAPKSQTNTGYGNKTFDISGTVPTYEGYTFVGWALAEDADESEYAEGNSVTIPSGKTELTLFAVWTPEEEISDDEPPLAELPEEPTEEIPDEQPPLLDLPEEQPPLVNWPVIDVPTWIPDEQPPLADIPGESVSMASAEPEIEIADEDVPMAGVPQTGDISLGWYAAAILSLCGLAVLTLKKREDEAV